MAATTVQQTMTEISKTLPTEHPHIVRVPDIGNGEPIVRGSRVSVRLLAEYYKAGLTVDEIVLDYPHLNPAAIFDAISYYIDHQQEIEDLIESNRIERVLAGTGLVLRDGELVPYETTVSG